MDHLIKRKKIILILGFSKNIKVLFDKIRKKNFNFIIIGKKKELESEKDKKVIQKIYGSIYNHKNLIKNVNKIKTFDDFLFRSSDNSINYLFNICKYHKKRRVNKFIKDLVISKKKLNEFLRKEKLPFLKEITLKKKKKIKLPIVIKPDSPLVGKKSTFCINNFNKNANFDKFQKKAINNSSTKKIFVTEYIGPESIIAFYHIEKKTKKLINFGFYFEKNIFKKNKVITKKIIYKKRYFCKEINRVEKNIVKKIGDFYGFFSLSFLKNQERIVMNEFNIGVIPDYYLNISKNKKKIINIELKNLHK